MSTPLKSESQRSIDAPPKFWKRPSAFLAHGPHALARRGPSAIPWGVAVMVGLIVIFECLVTRYRLELTDPVSMSWYWMPRR